MYDKSTRDNLTKSILLEDILAITKDVSSFFFFSHAQKEDKNGYCFTLELDEKSSTFYCLDENSRDEWVRSIASFCLLRMVTSDLSFSAERLQAFLSPLSPYLIDWSPSAPT